MIGFQYYGGPQLKQGLDQLSPRVSRNVQRDAMLDASEVLRKEISIRAPRRPPQPDIADHIIAVTVRGEDSQQVVIAVGPERSYFYGAFLELGTAFMSAIPFVRPAFDSTVSKVLARFAANVWTALSGRGITRGPSSPGGGGLL